MTPRRCSHCGINGHNSRTCHDRKGCLKLFSVQISDNHLHDDNPMKRSLSMNQRTLMMMHINSCNIVGKNDYHHHGDDGYLSDGLTEYGSYKPQVDLRRRKKGVPWTEEEHKTFLIKLKKLGRGDWRGISKNFVHSRSPIQLASHAQKYFTRQLSAKNVKRRKR